MSSYTYMFDKESMECFNLGNYALSHFPDICEATPFEDVLDKGLIEVIYYMWIGNFWKSSEEKKLEWIDEIANKLVMWGKGRRVFIYSEYYEDGDVRLSSFEETGKIYRDAQS